MGKEDHPGEETLPQLASAHRVQTASGTSVLCSAERVGEGSPLQPLSGRRGPEVLLPRGSGKRPQAHFLQSFRARRMLGTPVACRADLSPRTGHPARSGEVGWALQGAGSGTSAFGLACRAPKPPAPSLDPPEPPETVAGSQPAGGNSPSDAGDSVGCKEESKGGDLQP